MGKNADVVEKWRRKQ